MSCKPHSFLCLLFQGALRDPPSRTSRRASGMKNSSQPPFCSPFLVLRTFNSCFTIRRIITSISVCRFKSSNYVNWGNLCKGTVLGLLLKPSWWSWAKLFHTSWQWEEYRLHSCLLQCWGPGDASAGKPGGQGKANECWAESQTEDDWRCYLANKHSASPAQHWKPPGESKKASCASPDEAPLPSGQPGLRPWVEEKSEAGGIVRLKLLASKLVTASQLHTSTKASSKIPSKQNKNRAPDMLDQVPWNVQLSLK